MKKAYFLIAFVTAMILCLTGCAITANRPAAVTSSPSQTNTDTAAIVSPSAEASANSAELTPSPSPSPTVTPDPIENMFNIPDEPSQEIGEDVISDGGSIYYFSDRSPHNCSISMLDIATQESKVVLSTKAFESLEGMFMDNSGNLYYWGEKTIEDLRNLTLNIIKYDGKKQSVILKDVAGIFKVDNNYIYFSVHNSEDWDGLFLKKYDLQTGAIEDVKVDGNGYIIPFCIFQNKPIMLFRSSKGILGGPYSICNLNTGIVQQISSLDEYGISIDQKSIIFYQHDQQYANVFSLENEFGSVNIKLPLDQIEPGKATSFPTFDFPVCSYICNGRELQFIFDNYYYAVDISTGKLLEKICLIDGKDSSISCRILNGKWYVLAKKPLTYKSNLLIEVQPALYTIDIASHELKCVWKADSYKNKGKYAGLDFSIESGNICLYVSDFKSLIWKVLPISDLDKGQ